MEVGKLLLVLIFSVIPVFTIQQPGGKFFIINKKYIYPSKQQRQAKSTTTESMEQVKTAAGVQEITVPGKVIWKQPVIPIVTSFSAKPKHQINIEQVTTTGGFNPTTTPTTVLPTTTTVLSTTTVSMTTVFRPMPIVFDISTTSGAPTTITINPKTTATDPKITTYHPTITKDPKTTITGSTTTSTSLNLTTTTDPTPTTTDPTTTTYPTVTRVQTATTDPTKTTTHPTPTTTEPTTTTDPTACRVQTTTADPTTTRGPIATANSTIITTEPTISTDPTITINPKTTATDPKITTYHPTTAKNPINTRNPETNTDSTTTTTTAKPIISTISPLIVTSLPNTTTPVPESTLRISKNECDGKLSDAAKKYIGLPTPATLKPKHMESITPEGCTAEQIWILGMQGAEYPSNEDIQEMQYDLPVLRTAIKEKANQEWSPNPNMVNKIQHWLVREGYKEWEDISNRFQQRFPSLFPNTFNSDRYYFRGTGEQSSQKSAMAFAGAIFGNSLDSLMIAPPIIDDPVLQFYKKCAKYIKQVKNNPEATYEAAKFLESPVFKSALKEMGRRLGLNRDVTKEETLLMYKTCKYETVWKSGEMSPWCSVFDGKHFEILEYYQDLQEYWKEGYAYPIAYEQACMPLKDMVDTFTAKIVSENEYYHNRSRMGKRLTTAYFGSREAIQKIYARLGLLQFQNQGHSSGISKNASDSNTSHSSREWMYGKIGGFASNIAFVLFSCAQSHSDFRKWVNYRHHSIGPTWKIGTLVQEQPVVLPVSGCQGDWLCSFDDFVKSFEHVLDTCDLNEICKV